jgi:hypothetical protein
MTTGSDFLDTEELAINKLIILSILSRISGITLNQLTTLSLETLYLDYFDFVTAFEDLCRDQLAMESVRKGEETLDAVGRPVTRCDVTEAGRAVLSTLESRIPLPIRSYLAQACIGWQKDKRMQSILTAAYEPDGNGFYQVRLKQNDGLKDLIDLRLTTPDKSMAIQICERWKRHPQTVYLGLLSLLTGEVAILPEEQVGGAFISIEQVAEPETASGDLNDYPPDIQPVDPNQQSFFN